MGPAPVCTITACLGIRNELATLAASHFSWRKPKAHGFGTSKGGSTSTMWEPGSFRRTKRCHGLPVTGRTRVSGGNTFRKSFGDGSRFGPTPRTGEHGSLSVGTGRSSGNRNRSFIIVRLSQSGMSFEASSPQQDQSKECSPVCERCGSGGAAPSLPEVAQRLDPRHEKVGAAAHLDELRQSRNPAS